jgi:hypothetical protein
VLRFKTSGETRVTKFGAIRTQLRVSARVGKHLAFTDELIDDSIGKDGPSISDGNLERDLLQVAFGSFRSSRQPHQSETP